MPVLVLDAASAELLLVSVLEALLVVVLVVESSAKIGVAHASNPKRDAAKRRILGKPVPGFVAYTTCEQADIETLFNRYTDRYSKSQREIKQGQPDSSEQ